MDRCTSYVVAPKNTSLQFPSVRYQLVHAAIEGKILRGRKAGPGHLPGGEQDDLPGEDVLAEQPHAAFLSAAAASASYEQGHLSKQEAIAQLMAMGHGIIFVHGPRHIDPRKLEGPGTHARATYASPSMLASRHLPSTINELLRQCRSIQHLNQLHAHLVVHGSPAVNAVAPHLLASYCALSSGKPWHGALCYARHLFDGIPDPDRVTCNNLVRAYSNSGHLQEALRIHRRMLRRGILPNEFTMPFVLKASTRAQAWEHARAVHAMVVKLGFVQQVFVGNALLHSYASAGLLGDSRRFFDEMLERTVVSWNSMIGGYGQVGDTREALTLFREMRCQRLLTDEFTFASLLFACSQEESLQLGQLVHCHMLVSGAQVDLILGNALVDMYGKCGICVWLVSALT